MKHKAGTLCLMLGVLLLAAALALFGYNEWQAQKAGRAAEAALQQVAAAQVAAATAETAVRDPMPVQQVDGAAYIGTLSFPTLDLELPVLANWAFDSLQTAPCRYSGSLEEENLVVAGHNYTRHFGRLDLLRPGDVVQFTTMDGVEHDYMVAVVETLPPEAVAEMTAGEYPLSLFTCDYSGQARITVRCQRSSLG